MEDRKQFDDSHPEHHDHRIEWDDSWIEKKIPVAVLIILVTQLIVGVWTVSGFYANQNALASKFSENFSRIELTISELEKKMYTRQEAILELDVIRRDNARQDSDIRDMEKEFRDIVIEHRNAAAAEKK